MRTLRVVQWATGAVGDTRFAALSSVPSSSSPESWSTTPKRSASTPVRSSVSRKRESPAPMTSTPSWLSTPTAFFTCRCRRASSAATTSHDVDIICKLLASGKNVITTTGFVYPMAYGAGVVDRIEKACQEGGTTLHGTGINPGFVSDVLPLTLTGLSSRLDHIYVRETSDYRGHPSRHIVTDLIGFARTAKDYVTAVRPFRAFQRALFTESVQLVSGALGVELDEIEETDEFELATEDFEIASGMVRQGTVSASPVGLLGPGARAAVHDGRVRLQGRRRQGAALVRTRVLDPHRGQRRRSW